MACARNNISPTPLKSADFLKFVRQTTLAVALAICACGPNMAVERHSTQESDRSIGRFEAFVMGLGDLFDSTRIDDPERVQTNLQVRLVEKPTKTPGFRSYSVSRLPPSITRATYVTRELKDGQGIGDLRLWINGSVTCLTMGRLRELTKLEFKRQPIFWHSRDMTNSGWANRYFATKTKSQNLRTTFSAKLDQSGCVGLIEFVELGP